MSDEPNFGETCQQCGQPATYGPGICKMCYAFGDLEPEKPVWQPIETAPRDGVIVFAVPVYGSPLHPTRAGKFLRWDVWADDASENWEDERESGWRMADATHWMPLPEPPEEA